jgi:hypothetical protein
MIHRRTGAIVGPIAPIHQEDWPFVPVPDNEILWRYMNLEKFRHLLEKSALYFARPDTFGDPFERRLSTGNLTRMSASEEAFRALYKIGDVLALPALARVPRIIGINKGWSASRIVWRLPATIEHA